MGSAGATQEKDDARSSGLGTGRVSSRTVYLLVLSRGCVGPVVEVGPGRRES